MQVVEEDREGKGMKKIFFILFVFLSFYQISYASNKHFLYKDYYYNMPFNEALSISNPIPCKYNANNLCLKNEQFSGLYWDMVLNFENGKLKYIDIESSYSKKDFVKSLNVIQKNKMLLCNYINENRYVDLIIHKKEIKDILREIFNIFDSNKMNTFVYMDMKYIKRNSKGQISDKTTKDIIKRYPKYERIVIANKIYDKMFITFGTIIDFLAILDFYAKEQDKRDF